MILIFEIPKIAKNCWVERLGYLNLDPKTMGYTRITGYASHLAIPPPKKKHKSDLVIPKKQKTWTEHNQNLRSAGSDFFDPQPDYAAKLHIEGDQI